MRITISVLVENRAGVLSRVSGMFARRAYNIESLAVGTTEDKSLSRITIVVDDTEQSAEQICKQLNKIIDVIKVRRLPENDLVTRELVLVKVASRAEDRVNIANIGELIGAKIADISINTMTLELSDVGERIDVFVDLLKPFGIKEMVRTGMVALQKGNDTINQVKK